MSLKQISKLSCSAAVAVFCLAICVQRSAAQFDPFGRPTTADTSTSGAVLKTDADLEALLERAERFRQDGNYRLASLLWQSALERSGDVLFSEDGEVYYSIRRQVETTLAQLPPESLQQYRLTADAAAREILAMADGPNDIRALSQVVGQYFVSSLGDEAALRLASIYLDRFDFSGAIRLLRRVVDQYPDPSVPMDQVWLRLAVAYHLGGHPESAQEALQQAARLLPANDSLLQNVRRQLQQQPQFDIATTTAERNWPMRHGNPQRRGTMPPLPAEIMDTDLRAVWMFAVEPLSSYERNTYQGRVVLNPMEQATTEEGESGEGSELSRAEGVLAKRWRTGGWRPASDVLVHHPHVVFKTGADVTVWPTSADQEEVVWRPLWLNQFTPDEASRIRQQLATMGVRGREPGPPTEPSSAEELLFFADQIHQSMSIVGGVLYVVEGRSYSPTAARQVRRDAGAMRGIHWNVAARRTRTNFLAAYEIDTGRILWRIPSETASGAASDTAAVGPGPATAAEGHAAEGHAMDYRGDDDTDPMNDLVDCGFMSAPVGLGNLLLVPVNVAGSIWIYALDATREGQVVWRSFLCDEPASGSAPMSPITLTLEGSDLYVATGLGAFFQIDPFTGVVNMARRYQRIGRSDPNLARGYNIQTQVFDGWSEDMVLVHGGTMILLASDSDRILAFNTHDGKLRWEAPSRHVFGTKVDYLLGVHDGLLIAGGRDTVIAYDLNGEGRMVWQASDAFENESSYGRGIVTADAVYVPVRDSIVKLDVATGQRLGRVGVRLPRGAPVGNLTSDGQRLWVNNGNRLYALANVADQPDDLPPAPDVNTDPDAGDAQDDVPSRETTDSEQHP